MVVGVLGGIQDGPLDVEGARFRIAATENKDQILAAQRLRHEFPSLVGLGVATECSLHQRRRVELGFHGFHQVFSGVLGASQARLFFFDFAYFTVDLAARGFRKGVEKFLKAFGLAEFAGEGGMDGHGEGKTLPRMTLMEWIFKGGDRFLTRRWRLGWQVQDAYPVRLSKD